MQSLGATGSGPLNTFGPLIKFGIVGLCNSAIGFAVIMAGLKAGLGDFAANALGYGLGLLISYTLNRRWTFAVKSAASLDEFLRFLACFGFAYAANLLVIEGFRTIGMVGRPTVHLVGMAVYSVLFYLLSRHFTFGQGAATGRRQMSAVLQAHAPLLSVGALAIATFLIWGNMALTHDVVWQFWIAHQMVHGARLYTDIWEVNPPLWFWSAVPIDALGERLHVPPLRLLVALVIASGAAAALAVGWLGEFASPNRRLVGTLLVFWLLVVSPLSDFGQREQLALIAATPYAALLARRSRGAGASRAVPRMIALMIGAGAAYGFALKHYFVIIPVMLEIWLYVRNRRDWHPLRVETVMLAVAAVVYALCTDVFAKAFFTDMLPMIRLAYHGYDSSWRQILLASWVPVWALVAGWFAFDRSGFGKHANPLVSAMLVVSAGFIFAYFVQGKSWQYHALPATGALVLALAIRFCDMDMRRTVPVMLGLAMLLPQLLVPVAVGPSYNFLRPAVDPVVQSVPAGQPVLILGADPMWAWPTLQDHGLVWPSRLYTYWMIPAIAQAESGGNDTLPMRALARRIQAEAALEMRCAAPALVMFEHVSRYKAQPVAFDERAFFMQQPDIRDYLAAHYREVPFNSAMVVYRRIDGIRPLHLAACPIAA